MRHNDCISTDTNVSPLTDTFFQYCIDSFILTQKTQLAFIYMLCEATLHYTPSSQI